MVNILFMHPDLGIGGAERLVVDSALALKSKGHKVAFLTNHHDKKHCFPETKDGTLPVTVAGDWIPRHLFGYLHAFFAYLRMLYLSIYMILFVARKAKPELLFCDQIPIGVPLFKLFSFKVIFYCHFPDLLLSAPGGNLKSVYRKAMDWVEETSIGYSDQIVVNSIFTLNVFKSVFTSIDEKPKILYPSIHTTNFDNIIDKIDVSKVLPDISRDSIVFLSINRYERKKNLELAIRSLQALETLISDEQYNRVHLVMMGGYDERLAENREYYEELQQLSEEQKLTSKITFLKSPSEEVKVGALLLCACVLYTPENEHFGIVPVEAMYAKRAVIAVQSGGPNETVHHEKTGFLTKPVPEYFAHFMSKFVNDPELSCKMGEEARHRFDLLFSYDIFCSKLDEIINIVISQDK